MARQPFKRVSALGRAVTAAVVVVAGLQLVPVAASAAPLAGSLAASLDPPTVKEQVVLTGSLPPARQRPVILQRRAGTGAWSNTTTTTSRADGAFTFTVTMPSAVNSVVRYRVLANQAVLGGTSYPAVQTPDVVLRTAAQTSSLTAPASTPVGSTYAVVADFGPDRPGRPVVLQRRSGTAWVAVVTAVQDATGAATFTLPAGSAPGTVTYRALAKKWQGAPQVISATRAVTISAAADTTPPPVPGGLAATPGDTSAQVSWNGVTAGDLAGYRLYRASTSTGAGTLVASPTTTSHQSFGLTNGEVVWFSVSSLDATGNESARSAAVSVTPTDTTAPSAPVGLVATAGDGAVSLVWDAVADAVEYRLARATSDDGPWTAAGSPTSASTDVTGLQNGTAYWFTVAAVDAAGNVSEPSAPASATPADSTPPPPVTLLSAVPSDRQVTLSWESSSSSDVTGYDLQRSESADGAFVTAAQGVSASPYTITGLANGTTRWFRVLSRDAVGNLSEPSEALAATPVDDVAPPVPGTVTATPTDRSISLAWGGAYGGADYAGFHVYVGATEEGPWTQLTTAPVETHPYVVTGLTNGETYWLTVTSVDTAGNQSAYAEPTSAIPLDDVAPPVPTGVSGVATPGKVTVSWDAVVDGGLVDYVVMRGPSETGPWERLEWDTSTATTFEDASVVPEVTYWYTVQSVDAAGNWSAPSDATEVSAAETTPPAVPSGLVATAGDRQVSLTWDAVADADLAGYRVYRAEATEGPWTAVGGLVTTPIATVDGLANGTASWFAVSTVDSTGNESARSTGESATPRRPTPAPPTLSAGTLHGCQVLDGSMWCWGSDGIALRSEPARVGTETDWASVDAGNNFTCATQTDGTLWCWGSNQGNRLGDGSTSSFQPAPVRIGGSSDWVSVSAGEDHGCGTRTDGTAWCWGDNAHGQVGDGTTTRRSTPVQVGAGTDWVSISAAVAFTCGTRTDGTAWCWGANVRGQLGDGTTSSRSSPVQVGTGTGWVSVSGGQNHACGTRTDDSAWCWGWNLFGQLGDGTSSFPPVTAPVRVGTGTDWVGVTAGSAHSCGTRTDGTAWCWGRNIVGELGTGSALSAHVVPVQVGPGWTFVTAGLVHTCGLRTDGTTSCWGDNAYSQLGNGHGAFERDPQQVPGSVPWRSVAAGPQYSCGTRTDGTTWCWGSTGSGTVQSRYLPVQVGTSSAGARVTAGGQHTCDARTDGTAWCWGSNSIGQLGDGTTTSRTTPVQVGSGTDWAGVTAGGNHTCGTRTDGTAWCWGYNAGGRLGDGTTTDRTTPVQVGTADDWVALTAGDRHTCGTRTDGTAWCWGSNGNGELGDGTTVGRTAPVQVGTGTDWATLTAAANHTCGTRTDGTAWCWGYNAGGRLGDGTTTGRTSPVRIGSGTDWATVVAGASHTCGTRTDGTAWCWGYNAYSQLGDGTTADRSTPVRVGVGTDWAAVTAGGNHTCGTRTDGTASCWGANGSGQLSRRTFETSPVGVLL